MPKSGTSVAAKPKKTIIIRRTLEQQLALLFPRLEHKYRTTLAERLKRGTVRPRVAYGLCTNQPLAWFRQWDGLSPESQEALAAAFNRTRVDCYLEWKPSQNRFLGLPDPAVEVEDSENDKN